MNPYDKIISDVDIRVVGFVRIQVPEGTNLDTMMVNIAANRKSIADDWHQKIRDQCGTFRDSVEAISISKIAGLDYVGAWPEVCAIYGFVANFVVRVTEIRAFVHSHPDACFVNAAKSRLKDMHTFELCGITSLDLEIESVTLVEEISSSNSYA